MQRRLLQMGEGYGGGDREGREGGHREQCPRRSQGGPESLEASELESRAKEWVRFKYRLHHLLLWGLGKTPWSPGALVSSPVSSTCLVWRRGVSTRDVKRQQSAGAS